MRVMTRITPFPVFLPSPEAAGKGEGSGVVAAHEARKSFDVG